MTTNYETELETIRRLALEAGEIARSYYKSEYEVTQKGEDNPLTTADLKVNEHLEREIKASFPEDGWLSEETRDSPDRLEKKRCWIVDPIDGTKEFIKGLPEFCISIALSVEGEAVLGVLHNPATGELFYGARGLGVKNEKAEVVELAIPAAGGGITLVASRSELKRDEFSHLKAENYEITACGSVAYKLGLVAAGKYNVNFSMAPKNEWDVAAGIALIQVNGGKVTDLDGEPYVFNQAKTLRDGIVAGPVDLVDAYLKNWRGYRPPRD